MRFWFGVLVVTLLTAGGLSYLASSSPDGLDSATLRGCAVVERGGVEELTGQCIARSAHQAGDGTLLAGYSVGGADGTVGVAGIIGVVVTLTLAGTAFWVISRTRPGRTTGDGA